jgi:hypothetical protein
VHPFAGTTPALDSASDATLRHFSGTIPREEGAR